MYAKDPNDVKWFSCPSSVDEARALYHKLALKFHPHRGGAAVMAAINAQYISFLELMDRHAFVGSDGKFRTYRYNANYEQSTMQIMDQLLSLRMAEVDILLIGVYILVQGRTGRHTTQLKELGLQWHHRRPCWYWKMQDLSNSTCSGAKSGRLGEQHGDRHSTSDHADGLLSA